jgi:hypothetical protein
LSGQRGEEITVPEFSDPELDIYDVTLHLGFHHSVGPAEMPDPCTRQVPITLPQREDVTDWSAYEYISGNNDKWAAWKFQTGRKLKLRAVTQKAAYVVTARLCKITYKQRVVSAE